MLVETKFYESWRVFFRERIVNYALNVVGTYLRRLATETERVAVRRCICPHRPEARPQRGRRVLQSRCRSPAYDASPMHDWTDATRRERCFRIPSVAQQQQQQPPCRRRRRQLRRDSDFADWNISEVCRCRRALRSSPKRARIALIIRQRRRRTRQWIPKRDRRGAEGRRRRQQL